MMGRRTTVLWAGAAGLCAALSLTACGPAKPASAAQPGAAGPTQVASGGGGLADGEYDCGGGYTYHAMGKVDIRGGQFRFRPFGEVSGGFAPYTVGADNQIQWGGPFPGIDEPPSRVVSSTKESFGFNVNYQGNPSALVNTMSCNRE